MAGAFDLFVVFAEMRTGSNFLEANLNRLAGVQCHGEAFNPHFIGYPGRDILLGLSQAERDAEPGRLLSRLRDTPGILNGFRYFHDHDPRILDELLDDPRCAKIILTRNPADSYVSWKIAQTTDQWKLTNVARHKFARAQFDAAEFDARLATLQAFQLRLLRGLQVRGQTAFYIGYDDLQDVVVLNGLARWLGLRARLDGLDGKMKRQNPDGLARKVENFAEMERALAGFDRFDLARTPVWEPRRGPAVTRYVAAPRSPLLFQPIPGAPDAGVRRWLARLDDVPEADIRTGLSQKDLRRWMRAHPGHRRFTVLSHPLERAHHTFCTRILEAGAGSDRRLREALITRHGLDLPDAGASAEGYDTEAHRRAFLGFLRFLKRNLAGQTNLRVDPAWGSQANALQGMAGFAQPDLVLRASELDAALPGLARSVGCACVPASPAHSGLWPFALEEIHDAEVEDAARDAYARDYMLFGFEDWRPEDAQAALTRSASVRIV